jgi:flavin-dependent dehydrogenase
MKPINLYDVVIIGGGPSGSAAGAQLAKSGKRVLILEKESFPRFTVGESLLPHGNDLLREIGVWDKMEQAGFLRKYGAEFSTGDGGRLKRFWFAKNLGQSREYTYQVERSQFDHLLLNHARDLGCEVLEQTKVQSLIQHDPKRVELECTGPHGTQIFSSRWVIDASGRNSFAGCRVGLKRKSTQKNRRVAIYGHFEGVFRNSGKAEGHITIARLAEGWFWLIPLAGNRTSVGLVLPSEKMKGGSPDSLNQIFNEAVQANAEVKARMLGATPITPLAATGDYSWKFSSFASERVILTGDAAGFVDPIFSSGVMLALKSAIRASRLINHADSCDRFLTRWERFAYTREITGWMNQYARIIRAFYDRAGFEVFMNPSPFMKIPESIGRLVGGDADPGIFDRIRRYAFHIICRIQRFFPIAPAITSLR